MKHLMGEGWHLKPAGGATGEAYLAEQGDQKIFIKRNSSPFLAVLSAEGIVPKLLWTKRLENGDVITAQKWVDGRERHSNEMNDNRVARLLSKIHSSNDLLDMFKRMGNNPLRPEHIHFELTERRDLLSVEDPAVSKALNWLGNYLPGFAESQLVVCHADINHNNWIDSSDGQLYLIDWDCAQVADPALDIAPLLYLYIPEKDWREWLHTYGAGMDEDLLARLKWYMVAQCVDNILWNKKRNELKEVVKWTDLLNRIMNK